MITWIASYPRSGNTFARIALFHLFGIRSSTIYPVREGDDARTIAKIMGEPDPEMTSEEMDASPDYFFAKTHEFPGEEPGPAVYFVRDGRDALVSYAHFILHEEHGVAPGSDRELFLWTLQNLVIGKERFGGWSSHVLAWTQRSAPTSLVHFEDLIAEPEKALRQALTAVGQLPPVSADASLPVFDRLHDAVPWFFRKGRVGAWRTEMPPYLQALFWSLHGDVMRALGYEKEGLPEIELLDKDQERAVAAISQQVRRGDALEATAAAQQAAIRDRDRVIAQLDVAAAERLAGMHDRDRVIAELNAAASERLTALLAVDSALGKTRSELQQAIGRANSFETLASERLTAVLASEAALEETRRELRNVHSELAELRGGLESESLRKSLSRKFRP